MRVDRYVPLHYTLAQKSDPGQFHAGQVLVFHADTPEVRRHEALEIVRVEPHQLVARTEAGEEHVVTATQAQAFDVYERRPIEIAPHDRLLLTANRRGVGPAHHERGDGDRLARGRARSGCTSRMVG